VAVPSENRAPQAFESTLIEGRLSGGSLESVCPDWSPCEMEDPMRHQELTMGVTNADIAHSEFNQAAWLQEREGRPLFGIREAVVAERYLNLGESLEDAKTWWIDDTDSGPKTVVPGTGTRLMR